MGAFLERLWHSLFAGPEVKVVTVGLDNAGKTTIVYRLLLGQTVATTPTVGSNVEEIARGNLRFVVWDLGGQKLLRDNWLTYYANTNAVIFVVDSTDRERLAAAAEEFHKMLQADHLRDAIVLVFANKQDVKGALNPAEISEAFGLHTLKDREWHIEPCCGLTGAGLDEGLDWIAQKFQEKK